MKIRFNGEQVLIESQQLADFLLSRVDPNQAFAVALNGDFVAKQNYATITLSEGDELDVLIPMQGG
ncbi:sulfur carrier protein ThiS [Planctobacterium marinum]|uniref:Thiamine biosynthesis protein ThiS n=1 Tax=Planctobacterium marinum TaxID=1631968 RepID=A0AA48I9W9_9ALTE|nr:hypothetical protein MACH26_41610 [Planctobacterium marinum]